MDLRVGHPRPPQLIGVGAPDIEIQPAIAPNEPSGRSRQRPSQRPETRRSAPPRLRSSMARCKAQSRPSGYRPGREYRSVRALTVTPATSADVPRHPACEAATNRPDRSVVRRGAQSATWTATTRSAAPDTTISASGVPQDSAATTCTALPCTCERPTMSFRDSPMALPMAAQPVASTSGAPRNWSCRVVQPCDTSPSARHCRARPHGAATHANSSLTAGGTSPAL